MISLLFEATGQTLIMVLVSTFMGLVVGLPLAAVLFTSHEGGLYENPAFHKIAGFFVNGIRSVPYIILIIALIPVTRFIAGSSIGTAAACVPLSVASMMLVARVGEEAFRTVPKGLVEAAHSMGATRLQIILKVLLPESLPTLVGGMTLVVISLIGFFGHGRGRGGRRSWGSGHSLWVSTISNGCCFSDCFYPNHHGTDNTNVGRLVGP